MYGLNGLVMLVFLGFPTHDLPFISCFSLLFIFVQFSFSFVVSLLLGALFLLEFSLLPLHFFVKFLCSYLCFCSFMVDYSLVRSDCPKVSFFFARLCGLLEVVGRKHPRVGLFIEKKLSLQVCSTFLFSLSLSLNKDR